MEVLLKNFKELLSDSAIPLLGIFSEKTIIQKDTCTSILIAGLLIIVRTVKQPKRPSTEEWITELWHIYTCEYTYTHIHKGILLSHGIMPFIATWMDL